MNWPDVAIGILTSGVVATAVSALFQASVQGKIQKEVDRHKHELEKLMLTTRMRADKEFVLFPELLSKLRIAQGRVGPMVGPGLATNWSVVPDTVARRRLEEFDVTPAPEALDDLFAAVAKTPRKRGDLIREFERGLDEVAARNVVGDAQNFIVLNELFLPPHVYDQALEVVADLRKVVGYVSASDDFPLKERFAAGGRVRPAIEKLRESMRAALLRDAQEGRKARPGKTEALA